MIHCNSKEAFIPCELNIFCVCLNNYIIWGEVWVPVVMGKRELGWGWERADCLTLFDFLVSCYYYWSVALPHGVVGWSARCDLVTRVLPEHTHLLFWWNILAPILIEYVYSHLI